MYSKGVDLDKAGGLVMDVIYRNGVRQPHVLLSNISSAAVAAPMDLVSRHLHWSEETFPSFESGRTINAVRDCGCKGDGVTDGTSFSVLDSQIPLVVLVVF